MQNAKYLIQALIVAAATHLVPANKLYTEHILYIALASAVGFYMVDILMVQYEDAKRLEGAKFKNTRRLSRSNIKLSPVVTGIMIVGFVIILGIKGYLEWKKRYSSSGSIPTATA